MAEVVYFARDMLFTSKIREVARQLGIGAEGTRDVPSFVRAAAGARLLIVDLRLEGALEALTTITGDPAMAAVRTVGFVDHEKVEMMDAARAAGCQEILTKGQFAHMLPRLLAPPG